MNRIIAGVFTITMLGNLMVALPPEKASQRKAIQSSREKRNNVRELLRVGTVAAATVASYHYDTGIVPKVGENYARWAAPLAVVLYVLPSVLDLKSEDDIAKIRGCCKALHLHGQPYYFAGDTVYQMSQKNITDKQRHGWFVDLLTSEDEAKQKQCEEFKSVLIQCGRACQRHFGIYRWELIEMVKDCTRWLRRLKNENARVCLSGSKPRSAEDNSALRKINRMETTLELFCGVLLSSAEYQEECEQYEREQEIERLNEEYGFTYDL